MSHPVLNPKENFRLLDLSSDQSSEDLQLEIIPARKKKITRRERSRSVANPVKVSNPSVEAEVRCALRWAMRGTLFLWLVMLTWICASLYDQVSSLHLDLSKVSTCSESVSDALQIYHTAVKELQANASELSAKFLKLQLDHDELAKRVDKATAELTAISDQLAAAPRLADTPRRLAELQRTVADLGSQINGFEGTIDVARKQVLTATAAVDEVKTSLHLLEGRTNDTIVNVTSNQKKDEELKQQISTLNTTLVDKVQQLQNRIEEISKLKSTVAPSTTSSTTTTTTPSTTSASSTTTISPTTQTPAPPPVKPSVVQ